VKSWELTILSRWLLQKANLPQAALYHSKAKYSFHADSAGSTVQLGMGTCQAVSSVLAGKTPVIKKTSEGFLLQSDDQGIQELEMDFLAMVRQANGKFSLTLDLPGSSITQMEMELPSFSTEIKVGYKAIPGSPLELYK